jgi:hypothetical protein
MGSRFARVTGYVSEMARAVVAGGLVAWDFD